MSKRKSKLMGFFRVVIVLLVLALVVVVIVKFTRIDEKLTDLLDTSFRVEYCGVKYTGVDNKIYLPKGEQARFDVKSINGYEVIILPNVTSKTDFTYTVDGVEHKYSETNLTKAFLSQDNIKSDHFKLNAMFDYSLESVLSRLYKGQTVVVDNDTVTPYLLSITSGKDTIKFVICLGATDISIDIVHIEF